MLNNIYSRNLKDLVDSWTRQFVFRPGYYSGRGPTQSDLNNKILEELYIGIKKDIGAKEAANFVRFVNKLKDLSASSFIVAFEQFFYSKCEKIDLVQNVIDGCALDKDDDGEYSQAQIFALQSHLPDFLSLTDKEIESMSLSIKSLFIDNHKDEIPESECPKGSPRFYDCFFIIFKIIKPIKEASASFLFF